MQKEGRSSEAEVSSRLCLQELKNVNQLWSKWPAFYHEAPRFEEYFAEQQT